MKYLTRQEELILLAIFRLKDNAYIVTIREHLIKYTGKDWTVGAIYVPIDRMQKGGLLESYIGGPNAKRGRNAIKYYRLTKKGADSLVETKKVLDVMWDDSGEAIYEELTGK